MTGGKTMMFAAAARFLANEAQRFGLDAPGFRSPPRTLGVQRTLRRTEQGGVVAVLVRDRPFVAVLADMIEGVIVVNRLTPRRCGNRWSMPDSSAMISMLPPPIPA
jgi:hypothetical protein